MTLPENFWFHVRYWATFYVVAAASWYAAGWFVTWMNP